MAVGARRKVKSKTHTTHKRAESAGSVVSVSGEAVKNRSFEILSLILLAAAIFLTISLLSVTASVDSRPVMLTGQFGYKLASFLFAGLGWGTLCGVVGLLLVALYLPSSEPLRQKGIELHWSFGAGAGIILSMLAISSLLSVLIDIPAGGRVGAEIATPLIRFFGQAGGILMLGLIALFALSLIMGRSTFALIMLAGTGLISLLRLVARSFVTLCEYSLIVLGAVYGVVTKMVNLGLSYLAGQRENLPVSVLPAKTETITLPRARRATKRGADNQDTSEEPESEGLDEVGQAYTHVVVQRRGASEALARSAAKAKKAKSTAVKRVEYSAYQFPATDLLQAGDGPVGSEDDETLKRKSRLIEEKLKDFGVLGRVTMVHPGPVITLFEFEPAAGVKVGRVVALQDDLAMSLKASAVRIIAPIPGKASVGIEVPNPQRDIVRLRDVIESPAFTGSESSLTVPLGKNIYGDPVVVDIAQMPHLLMAGSTGTGKSVSINALLVGMLFKASPAELGLILIDPKVLELSVYDGIPHLRVPVVTIPKQAKAVLDWAVHEMDRRYRLMQKFGVRGVDAYNRLVKGELARQETVKTEVATNVIALSEEQIIQEGIELASQDIEMTVPAGLPVEELQPLSKIVIVIDELADLMLTVGKEIEELITRLAQKARAAGIHLIVATQRPSVDVITGLIKANFPARLSFRVSSRIDSRTILDSMGAERLLGKGDMLLMLPGTHALERVHGAYVSDQEVSAVVDIIKKNSTPQYDTEIIEACERALREETENKSNELDSTGIEYDDLYDRAVELVMQKGQASTSMLQRAFRIGYNRAARIIDTLEREGVIGPMDGAKPREVLMPQAMEDF